jgi:hypothetical protein
MNKIEFSYRSSSSLAKLAARRFMLRHVGIWILFALGIFSSCLFALLSGYTNWYFIAGLVATIGFLVIWISYYLRSDEAFTSMADPWITVRVADDSIEFETSEHTSKLAWSRVKQLWKFKDVWLLFTYSDTGGYTLLPTNALTEETRNFIEKRIKESGGKIA